MPTLLVDHRQLTYDDDGSGPVALLVHGSPGNARVWARVGERLAGRPTTPSRARTRTPLPRRSGASLLAARAQTIRTRHASEYRGE